MPSTPVMFCGRPLGFLLDADHSKVLMEHLVEQLVEHRPAEEHMMDRVVSCLYEGCEPHRMILTRNASCGAGQCFFQRASARPFVLSTRLWFSDDGLFDGTVFDGHMVPLSDGHTWAFLISDMLLHRGQRCTVGTLLQQRLETARVELEAHHVADDHDACLLRVLPCLPCPRARELRHSMLPEVDELLRAMRGAYPPASALLVRSAAGGWIDTILIGGGTLRTTTSSSVLPIMSRAVRAVVRTAPVAASRAPAAAAVRSRDSAICLWARRGGLPDVYELSESAPDPDAAPGHVGVVHACIPSLRISEAMLHLTRDGPARMRFHMHPAFGRWTPTIV